MNLLEKLYQYFKPKSENKSTPSYYYTSLEDLPLSIFFKILDTGKIDLLCYAGVAEKGVIDEIWQTLYGEYSKLFGRNEAYHFYLADKKRLIILEIDHALTKDRRLMNKIELIKTQIEAYEKENFKEEKSDHLKTVAVVEKYMNFSLDLDSISVARFYKYIELMNNEYKAKNNGKNN
jgi:hypothetical protein